MFRTVKRAALANDFARLRPEGVGEPEALRNLFDMVTTDGPVPTIDSRGHDIREDGKAS